MTIADTAAGFLAFGERQLNRFISSDTRRRAFDRVQSFATARPLIFTLIVAQVLTSLLPLALFLTFTASVLALSVGAALLFSLFWLGVALLFLIPTLFVTVTLGFFVFAWAIAARLAWAALPLSIKAAIAPGSPSSSSSSSSSSSARGTVKPRSHQAGGRGAEASQQQHQKQQNGAEKSSDISNGEGRSAPAPLTCGSTFYPETRDDDLNGMDSADVGVADLTKFKEEKDGNITP